MEKKLDMQLIGRSSWVVIVIENNYACLGLSISRKHTNIKQNPVDVHDSIKSGCIQVKEDN